MQRYLAAVLLSAGLMLPCVAQADEFTFTFAGSNSSASGTLTATGGPGTFTAISGSGTYTGFANFAPIYNASITLSPGTGSNGSFFWDNLIFPNAPLGSLLDGSGLLFQIAGTGSELNIFGNGAGVAYSADTAPPNYFQDNGTFTLTAVPEPGSILLMGTLLLGVAGALKRKLA